MSSEKNVTLKSVSKRIDDENAVLRAEIAQMKADFGDQLALHEKKYVNILARMELCESTVAVQKNTIELLKGEIASLRGESFSQEQYLRRSNIRINGISLPPKGSDESPEVISKIVKDVCTDLGVAVEPGDVFRAHRIGKKKKDEDTGRFHQSVIVRFRSWNARCALYRARPTRQRPRKNQSAPPAGYKSVSLDLTKESFRLLDLAREKIRQNVKDNDTGDGHNKVFCYADINCNLVVRFGDKNLKFFRNERELNKLFADFTTTG